MQQSATPVSEVATVTNGRPADSGPAEIARATLRLLAARSLVPTPENYQRVYAEIAGTGERHGDDAVEPLLAVLRELPRANAALKEPAERLQRALAAGRWKAFGAEILALSEAAAVPAGTWTNFAADPSAVAANWPAVIRTLLVQYPLRHATVSPVQKRRGLDRVLAVHANSPQLPDKLAALMRSWATIAGGGPDAQAETLQAETLQAEALPDAAASEAGAASVPGPEAPPAASAPVTAEPVTGASPVRILRDLLAQVLRREVAPRFAVEPQLDAELAALADLAARADSAEVCAALSDGLTAFWQRAADAQTQDRQLAQNLMTLVRLLVDNIGELVDDDQWIGGQVEVMRQIMAQPLTPKLVDDAQVRFREIIRRQSTLKLGLAEAKSTLKDMIAVFVERLGEMSQSTADYHDKIGMYARQIEGAEDIDNLRGVLDGLMGDIRAMQIGAQRSREEVASAREQAQAAESKIRQLESELEEISERVREDALTGSLNRRGLDEALAREAARAERYGNALCVGVLDLDNFKSINDTHGHDVGDRALIHLVSVVKSLLRPSDSIGRFGGEEFVVLLPETPLEQGKLALERLQRELTKQFFLANNQKLLVTFSAGVAQFRSGETEAELVKRADQAMYQAKQSGKNRVCIAH